MSQFTISMIFAVSLLTALLQGVGVTFILIYLPTLIMLNQLPGINWIPHAPVEPQYAPLYAMLIALPFRPEPLRFRWSLVDTVVILLLISSTITAFITEFFETGVNNVRTEILTWIGPYFLARAVFRSWEMRRLALYTLIALTGTLTFLALIEFRMVPYFYLHLLQSMGMGNKIHAMAYGRYGFFRVSGTVEHPIHFGNMCLVILGMIAVLARTSGVRLRNPWVTAGLLGALGCVVMSISFTPYMGLAAGTCFYLTLIGIPFTRKLVLPLVLLVIAAIFAFTYHAAHEKLGDRPDGDLQGSYWTRKLIITQSWKQAVKAGPFGFGKALDFNDDDFDLTSVDNSYMLFTMTRGWVYTTLWVSIAVMFGVRVTVAFFKITHRSQVFPLAVSTATVLGLMVSMYTVWAGALYMVVWAIMLGLSNTLIDQVIYPEWQPRRRRQVQNAQGGIPVQARPVTGGQPVGVTVTPVFAKAFSADLRK
jgi:hypothetical protein